MAKAVVDGAGASGLLITAQQAEPELLVKASAFIFVCPENLGAMSGAMKEMFDRCYYPLLDRVGGRAYATAIAAGSAGQGAEAQIDRIVSGWRLKRVADSLIVNLGAQTPAAILAPKVVPQFALLQCRELGQAMAEGVRVGIF